MSNNGVDTEVVDTAEDCNVLVDRSCIGCDGPSGRHKNVHRVLVRSDGCLYTKKAIDYVLGC